MMFCYLLKRLISDNMLRAESAHITLEGIEYEWYSMSMESGTGAGS